MAYTTAADFEARAAARLAPVEAILNDPVRTDFDLNPQFPYGVSPPYARAAVLCPLIPRADDLNVLLTVRPANLRQHAGQIAFPGGRLDPTDPTPLAAALREAQEEVGIDPASVRLLGQADPYLTSTGYAVSVFVGVLSADFIPRIDPAEVAEVFETPLAFLMNAANHERHTREFQGALRAYYAMPHNGRYIWGATAGMLKALHDRLYGEPDRP